MKKMDYKSLPKIELHCHLDGSLRVDSVIEMAYSSGLELKSYDYENVKKELVVSEECSCLDEYLDKFNLPIKILQSRKNLKRVTLELMEDAAKENVKYIEIRFAPILHIRDGLSLNEVIESVIDGLREAEGRFDIRGNLILSCLRHHSIDSVYEVINVGKKYIGKGVVAIDLAGGELEGFAYNYIEAIKKAKEEGFRITIHAGETGFGQNVIEAIELLGAERIGHGVFIKNHEEAYKLVKEKRVTLEMCPKSNIDTKAVCGYENHPIYIFHKDGIMVNLSTDNRTVSNVDLTTECENIGSKFNMTMEEYKEIYLNSINACFCTEQIKDSLKLYIN